jgi:TadE-like protein
MPDGRGQSFVELSLALLVLALLLAGVVEFGFLMNDYLHVLDGTREAARYASTSKAYNDDGSIIESFYVNTVINAQRVMDPVVLNGNRGDDMVISVLSVADGGAVTRYPNDTGWSLCANRSDTGLSLSDDDWGSCTPHTSNFTTAHLASLMDPLAPANGNVIVEVYYNYPQVLKLPIFNNDYFSMIPDPIPVFMYAAMPLSSAEPKVH